MKRFLLFVCVLMTSVIGFDAKANPKSIDLTDNEYLLVRNNNRFAISLFQKARAQETEQSSMVLSPLSITIDLGMLNNGADGITRDEIDAVLGSQDVGGAEVINQFCKKMLMESGTLDEKTRVSIANNIYFNSWKGYELLPAFVETAQLYYDATPEVRNFSDGQTRDAINQWCSDHTAGMIQEALSESEFRDDVVSYLLNAIYFKGEWTHKFNAAETRCSLFDEERAEVQMMHQYSEFSYAENNVYQSVILPYGNMAYQMMVFLPKWGKSIDDVLSALGEMDEDEWIYQYGTSHVDLYLPKFETSTDMHLEDIMKSLGLNNAFMEGHGFNKFCNTKTWISMMKQVAKIKLDEEGTEASAVTIIEDSDGIGAPSFAEFVADRPFLYIITERSTGTIFFMGQYMGEPLRNVRKDIDLTAEEKKLVESNNDFAFNLFRKARGEESSIMSPLSITYALGLMNNGAAGETQQEINQVLGFGDAGADAINAFCRKMLSEAPTLDETTAAEIANTVFVNSGLGFELQEEFIEKANAFYDAQPQSLDFNDEQNTLATINGWASDHTHGMIPEVLTEQSFTPTAVSYLLNALYFKGAWTNPFDKELTREESFNGGQTVPMMKQYEKYEYTENDLYQAVRLPYGNEAYLMTVFLPREGKTIDEALSKMSGKDIKFSAWTYDVDLKLPRLSTSSNISLTTIMRELGMPKAFTMQAEFPYFCNTGVYISNMFQKAIIDLNEEGTEAAAVTVIEGTTGMPRYVTFHANRPFFYTISERSTGAIFFIGQYTGPGTASPVEGPASALFKGNETMYNLAGQRISKPLHGLNIIGGKKVVVK